MGIIQFKDFWSIIKETFTEWRDDEPFRLSAVVAYYAVLSLPALMVISVLIAQNFYTSAEVQSGISEQISLLLGEKVANTVINMIEEASETGENIFSQLFSIGLLLFGATGVFYHLQKSLNYVWEVKSDPKKAWKKLIKDRVISFGMVLAIAFILLVTLVLSSLLSSISQWILSNFPDYTIYIFYIVNYVLSLIVITVLFALIFKYVPDVEIKWRDVWIGAAVTAFLFVLSEILLSVYFNYTDTGSSYGTAGSIVVIMLWVAYSCMIIFFGAEFTQVYARRYGEPIKPSEHARRTADFNRKVLEGKGRSKR